MTFRDVAGNRLYLNPDKRTAFLSMVRPRSPPGRAIFKTLQFTVCWISEAMELLPIRIDLSANMTAIRSLKKSGDKINLPNYSDSA